jgi:adenosine deaminase
MTTEYADDVANGLKNLTDLHIHMGGGVGPHILWSIAHDQGFKLPVSDYFEFEELISARPGKVHSLDEYLAVMHKFTEKIQSSPAAVERCTYEIISKEYRSSHVTTIELRFNPMKRNGGGERDLDHIILAAIRGMERATLEYPVSAGLILCLAREFDFGLNSIIVDKAIKYSSRGVVGVDLAGTEANQIETDEHKLMEYANLFGRARGAGLGITVHTGETSQTGPAGIRAIIEAIRPDRIGHGIQAAWDGPTMDLISQRKCVLEICPSSNLATNAVKNVEELGKAIRLFIDNGILITINTDGPYMLGTSMRDEFKLLLNADIIDHHEANMCIENGVHASFIR